MEYSIHEAKKELKNGINGYLQKDSAGNYIIDRHHCMPFYLEGKPGIGKTEIVKQVAEELGIGFVSFNITHHTRNSLLGLPVISQLISQLASDKSSGKYTEYTMSELIARPLECSMYGHMEGILLLDEFNCASETIMPTMLAFLQTRNIGKHTLLDGWCIVLCGNPPAYNRNARELDAVILDRVRKLSLDCRAEDFVAYAKEKGMHPIITEYLTSYPNHLYYCEPHRGTSQIVTCRGWENLSRTMQVYESLQQDIGKGLIEQYLKAPEIAHFFWDYYTVSSEKLGMQTLQEILNGKSLEKNANIIAEKSFEFQIKLVDLLVRLLEEGVAWETKKTILSKKIENAFRFLARLPEGSVFTDRLFMKINSSPELLMVMSEVKNRYYLALCKKEYNC